MIWRYLARKRAIELGLFDPEWYRRVHSDVCTHGMDPFKHYIRHGWLEGRNASPLMGEDFLCQVIPDGIDSGRNPVIEILSRMRRGGGSGDALKKAMALRERMTECGTRLIPGVTVAGFFGRSDALGEAACRMVEILDQAAIPCDPFNVQPLEEIVRREFGIRCRQVMERQAAIFVLDESSARWAVNHLRPGRLNVLCPCIRKEDKGKGWEEVEGRFEEVWLDMNQKHRASFNNALTIKGLHQMNSVLATDHAALVKLGLEIKEILRENDALDEDINLS